MNRSCGIYKIKNIKNNKIYIGSSNYIEKRWVRHKLDLKYNCHHSRYLQRSYNNNGLDNYEFTILELCEESKLLDREQYYLDNLKPEYNTSITADRCTHNEDTKKELSIRMSGKNNPWYGKKRPEHSKFCKENPPFKGKHHSLENKIKSSRKHTNMSSDMLDSIKKLIETGKTT